MVVGNSEDLLAGLPGFLQDLSNTLKFGANVVTKDEKQMAERWPWHTFGTVAGSFLAQKHW